jgi:hypothetical protein
MDLDPLLKKGGCKIQWEKSVKEVNKVKMTRGWCKPSLQNEPNHTEPDRN